MTQSLELTLSELALIENARKLDSLKLLESQAKQDKLFIESNKNIIDVQNTNKEQLQSTIYYHQELQKLNPNYTLITEDIQLTEKVRDVNDYKIVIQEINYNAPIGYISLKGTDFKIRIEQHIVYSSNKWSRKVIDKGYKMRLVGGGFYNERLVSNPKTLNEKIENKRSLEIRKAQTDLKKKNALETVFNKLTIQYPDAIITIGSEWQRNEYSKHKEGQTINTLTIKLANKVNMKLRVYEDQSISRMELSFPTKNNYELLESMNKLTFPK